MLQLRQYWRNNEVPGFVWYYGALFDSNVTTNPSMIQGNFGDRMMLRFQGIKKHCIAVKIFAGLTFEKKLKAQVV